MKKVRVAVIGYGHLGRWHCQKAAAHSEVAELIAIVEKFPTGQEAARKAHPGVRIVSDITEVLGEIDAAVVVTPTSTHFDLVKLLLEAGKHVFCEKPLCSDDSEGQRLRAVAQERELVLQVGHSERFHFAWELLRDELRKLPGPYTVRINRYAPFKGRATDVDVVQDLAIHDLDLVMHLFSQRPLSVSARGHKIRTDKWDHAAITLKLERGCEALITVGRNHVREVRELEVISSAGTILVDLFANRIQRAPAGQFEDGTFVREEPYEKRDHLWLEHEHFYRSIRTGALPIVGLWDGLAAVHLVDCGLKALQTGESVTVELPPRGK